MLVLCLSYYNKKILKNFWFQGHPNIHSIREHLQNVSLQNVSRGRSDLTQPHFFIFPKKIGIFLSKAQVIFFSSYKVSSTNRICIPDSKPVNKIWKHYIFVWSTNERIPLKWFRPSQNYGFTSSDIVPRFKVTKHRLECN